MKHTYFVPAFILYSLVFGSCTITDAQIMIGTTKIDTVSVATGLDTPWEILWGPDNHIWITERPGKISRLNPETKELQHLLTITDVHEQSESGLLGMALHPDFPDSSFVFLVYNYMDGTIKEKIRRYYFNGTALTDPVTLLDNIGGAGNHNGSRIVIDNDYKLFVTTGDATNTSTAQDLGSLSGKILRMNLDGSIPDDNPIHGSYLWTWGHRNPQGLVLAANGKMYSSEHGPNNDDELNLIVKGYNYGWPDVHGFCDQVTESGFCENNNVIEPLQAWTPTLAVAGIDYYSGDSIPVWKNNILITTLKESELVSLQLSADGLSVESSSVWFDDWFGRLRDICVSPDGRVFISTSNRDGRGSPSAGDDRIVQIRVNKNGAGTTGLNENGKEREFSVHPNPMHESAIVLLESVSDDAAITIHDLSGNLIISDRVLNGQYILDREDIPAGFYIINIVSKTINSNLPLIMY